MGRGASVSEDKEIKNKEIKEDTLPILIERGIYKPGGGATMEWCILLVSTGKTGAKGPWDAYHGGTRDECRRFGGACGVQHGITQHTWRGYAVHGDKWAKSIYVILPWQEVEAIYGGDLRWGEFAP